MGKTTAFRLVFLLCAAGVISAEQAGRAAWKGTVTVEGGVKVVKNPAEPLYGEFPFALEEDLLLGGDPEKEVSYFPRGAILAVDTPGNLFVVDIGNRRVQMFDRSGAFVRTIGRQGQGPGEYMFPAGVHFGADGTIWIDVGRQVVVFSKDGLFIKNVLIAKFMSPKMLRLDGSFIGTTQPSAAQGDPKHELIKVDSDGKTSRTIAEFRGELSQARRAISFHYYSNRICFTPVSSDSFAYGFSDEYKIYFADAEGKTTLVMTVPEKPQPISAKEKEETRANGIYAWAGENNPDEGVFFPDQRPFFSELMADDLGRIYVIRSKSILEKDGPIRVDVFSGEGIYLCRMTWTSRPAAIRSGFFYEVREDPETNEHLIIRHRINNWGQMRSR